MVDRLGRFGKITLHKHRRDVARRQKSQNIQKFKACDSSSCFHRKPFPHFSNIAFWRGA